MRGRRPKIGREMDGRLEKMRYTPAGMGRVRYSCCSNETAMEKS